MKRFLMLAAILLFLSACGSSAPGEPTVTMVLVQFPHSESRIIIGQTRQLEVVVLGRNNPPQTVFWSSSDETVVTVNEEGVVRGIAVGTANITATSTLDPSMEGSIQISVIESWN